MIWLLVSTLALAATPNIKLDLEARMESQKYSTDGYPAKGVDAWWVGEKEGAGLLAPGVARQYRHMHAMVVAAFYDKRIDHRKKGTAWLESYKCENLIACNDYEQFLDGAIKANILGMVKADRKRVEKLRTAVKKRVKEMEKARPPSTGVCAPDSPRAEWLSLEYALYCPAYPTGAERTGCGVLTENPDDCSDTKILKERLSRDSHQMVLSSAFLDKIHHRGAADCSKPWKVAIVCNGVGPVEYVLDCSRADDGKVSCK